MSVVNGLTPIDMAVRLGVSRTTIYNIHDELGLVPHRRHRAKISPELHRQVLYRYASGEGPTAIARDLGVTKHDVMNAVRRARRR